MRKAMLIVACLLASVGLSISQSKPKKGTTRLRVDQPLISKCGVRWETVGDFMQEMEIEWRVAAATKETMYFFNTHKMKCDNNGILRAWVKGTFDVEGKLTSDMTRYEFKCR